MEPDSLDYVRLSSGLCSSGSYTAASAFPEIARTPGYPLFLCLAWQPFLSALPVVMLQIMSDAAVLIIVYMLGLKLFSARAAIIAALFYALSTAAISGALKVLTETLFVFCVMTALFLLLPSRDKASARTMIFLSGVLIGISCLLRAVQLPLIPFFIIYGAVIWRRQSLFKNLITFIAPVLFITGIWITRNILTSDYYGFSSIGSVNTYRYNACALSASLSGRDFASEQIAFDRALGDSKTEAEKALAASKKGWALILAHPLEYIPVHLKGSFRAFLPADGDILRMLGFETGGNGTLAVMQSRGLFAGVNHYLDGRFWLLCLLLPGFILLSCEYAGAFIGVFYAVLRVNLEYLPWLILALVCVAYYLLVSGPAGHPRFRIPAEALICLFAGAGISALESYLNSSLVSGSTRRNSST